MFEARRTRTLADQLYVEPLIVPPLAEEALGRGNRGNHCQQDADRGKAARRGAGEEPCNAAELMVQTQSAPPGPDPCPAWTTEQCAYAGQDNCLHEEQGHDPE